MKSNPSESASDSMPEADLKVSTMPTAIQFVSALAPLANDASFQKASSMEKDAILAEKVAQWDDLKRVVGGNMRWFIGVLKTWLKPGKTTAEIASGITLGVRSLWDGLGKGEFPWTAPTD